MRKSRAYTVLIALHLAQIIGFVGALLSGMIWNNGTLFAVFMCPLGVSLVFLVPIHYSISACGFDHSLLGNCERQSGPGPMSDFAVMSSLNFGDACRGTVGWCWCDEERMKLYAVGLGTFIIERKQVTNVELMPGIVSGTCYISHTCPDMKSPITANQAVYDLIQTVWRY